jgi:hypothetical protein
MPNLTDVLEQELAKHDPGDKLQKILDAVTGTSTQFGALALTVDGFGKDIAGLKLAVQSIQQFLGAPDSGASQDQVDVLGAQLQNETDEITKFDAGLNAAPPTP